MIKGSNWNVKLDKHDKLGEGTYGSVKKGVFSKNGKEKSVAVKEFKTQKKGGTGIPINACREMGLLQELSHENIVNLLEIAVQEESMQLYLVMEYAKFDLGDLIWCHANQKSKISLKMVKSIMYQLLAATEYVHSKWVMHRDIKPANALITEAGVVKLADFGLARIFKEPLRPLIDDYTVVTSFYRAPELLLGSRHYTIAIDVWALGVTFTELIFSTCIFSAQGDGEKDLIAVNQIDKVFDILGKPSVQCWPTVVDMPFWQKLESRSRHKTHEESIKDFYKNVCDKLDDMMDSKPADNVVIAELLRKMLDYDPSSRMSCADAKKKLCSHEQNVDDLKKNVLKYQTNTTYMKKKKK